MTTLAERVRKALELSGKSQTELASACGIKAPSVNDWLSGKTKSLKATTAHRAASFLGVNLQWLTEDRGPMLSRDRGDESHSPHGTLPSSKDFGREAGHTPPISNTSRRPLPVHDLPVITAEQIMREGVPRGQFVWVSEDDHMAGGRMPAPRGHHVVIEPRARDKARPDRVVLLRIGANRPVLRRLTFGGDALYVVTESGSLPPVRLEEGNYTVLGVAVTAYPEPVAIELEGEEPAAEPRQRRKPRQTEHPPDDFSADFPQGRWNVRDLQEDIEAERQKKRGGSK